MHAKTLAEKITKVTTVRHSVTRLVKAVVEEAVYAERLRCLELVRAAAEERQEIGDPEGHGVLTDLAARIKAADRL